MAALGLGLGLSKHSSYTLGSAFDPDYQAVLNYATANAIALPDEANQAIQNARLIAWKEAGIWATRDFVFHFEGSNADFALIDWKRLTLATAVNSPNYNPVYGFSSNGTSSYINLNFNPSTFGGNFSTNNASILGKYHGVSFVSGRAILVGVDALDRYLVTPYFNTTQAFGRLGEGSGSSVSAISDAQGTKTICATKTASNRTVYINTTSLGTISIVPALANDNLFSLKYQANFAPTTFHSAIIMGGAGVTAGQNTDFNTSVI